MDKGLVFISILVVLGGLMMGKISINNSDSIITDQEFYRLQNLLNYSSDGALSVALVSNQVGEKEIDINPYLCSDIFFGNMLSGNDLPTSEGNMNYFYTKIPLVALALSDGIYVGYAQNQIHDETNKKTFKFVWENKMPYVAYHNGKAYALDMNTDYAISIETNAPYNTKIEDLLPEAVRVKKTEIINKKISQILNQTANKLEREGIHLFIPPQLTGDKMVSISGPCFISVVVDFDLNSAPIDYFSLATTEIINQKPIVGYIQDKIKKYCFVEEFAGEQTDIVQVFSTMEDAASAGFNPDLKRIK